MLRLRHSLTRCFYLRPFQTQLQNQSLFSIPIRLYTNRNLLSLRSRGLINDIFPNSPEQLTDLCNGKEQVVYAGFDPTADSLHVGHLAVLVLLLQCQRAGHSVIALIGGGTGMIGDPSGKNAERPELDAEIVSKNVPKIIRNIKTVFENHSNVFWENRKGEPELKSLVVVNNLDWYKEISAIDLIGRIGRHFRLGQMLGRHSVASRLESEAPISYTEFSYQVFQGYDWLHLYKKYGCSIQIGGHDQMGNIVSGHDLISRTQNKQVFGLTVPLVTTEAGNKFGKTAGNAVWLDKEKTSPFELYQFFLRIADSQVENYLNIFTFMKQNEIEAVMRKHEVTPEKRLAQKELAKNVTLLVHGELGLNSALHATSALYSEDIEALSRLTAAEVAQLFQTSKTGIGLSEVTLEPGTTILDMSLQAGCFNSKSDALRIISAGGFYINYQRVGNFEEVVVPGIHILPNQITLARVGKKNYHVIQWTK